jgi:hypothetical protein
MNLSGRTFTLTRREALRLGVLGTTGLLMSIRHGRAATLTPAAAPATSSPPRVATAKSVIQIWLWGGACHLDTFDPKPDAGNDYTGPFNRPIETNVSGIRINELLPLLAKQADKYSLIRSLTHGNNGHETAAYMTQTGRPTGGREVYPSMGAVVSHFKGYDSGYNGLLPPYMVLTEPQGRFSEAGFMGNRFKPFATGGDPSQGVFAVEGVVAPGLTAQRQQRRRDMLHDLDTLSHAMPNNAAIEASVKSETQAYDMILGDAGKVFDLTTEKDELRERYGRTKFGQSCLMARRLVERGVPYITLNHPGWDTHKQHFQTMRNKLPELDKGVATLLQDLAERGLLANTLVWCTGEFGRTPKVQWDAPWNGGRSHHGAVFSALVAGGGFKGGRVVGSSDARGMEVSERAVYPADLLGTMYELMGIPGDAKLPHPQGLPIPAMPWADKDALTNGRLAELV